MTERRGPGVVYVLKRGPEVPPEPMLADYISLKEAARLLGRTVRTFHIALSQLRMGRGGADGERWRGLDAVKINGRWFVPVAALDKLLADGERPGVTGASPVAQRTGNR